MWLQVISVTVSCERQHLIYVSSDPTDVDLAHSLDNAVEEFLGPKSERTANKPVAGPDDVLVGGTHFERLERPVGIDNTRAYTMAASDQVQNTVYSPVAWGKLNRSQTIPASVDDLPEHRRLRPRFVNVRDTCSIIYFICFQLLIGSV